MLPSSDPVPIQPRHDGLCSGPEALADAFSDFTLAAGRLESWFQELQQEVAQLRGVLAARNESLRSSQVENAQVKQKL